MRYSLLVLLVLGCSGDLAPDRPTFAAYLPLLEDADCDRILLKPLSLNGSEIEMNGGVVNVGDLTLDILSLIDLYIFSMVNYIASVFIHCTYALYILLVDVFLPVIYILLKLVILCVCNLVAPVFCNLSDLVDRCIFLHLLNQSFQLHFLHNGHCVRTQIVATRVVHTPSLYVSRCLMVLLLLCLAVSTLLPGPGEYTFYLEMYNF